MYYEHPDLSRDMGKLHLEDLIAEANAERLAAKVKPQTTTVLDIRQTLNDWLSHRRTTARRVAPKGI